MYSRHMASICTGPPYCHDRVLMMTLPTQYCLISLPAGLECCLHKGPKGTLNILLHQGSVFLPFLTVHVLHGCLCVCTFISVHIHVYACRSQRLALGIILRNTIYFFCDGSLIGMELIYC